MAELLVTGLNDQDEINPAAERKTFESAVLGEEIAGVCCIKPPQGRGQHSQLLSGTTSGL